MIYFVTYDLKEPGQRYNELGLSKNPCDSCSKYGK